MSKTICIYFQRGYCRLGEECNFAHGKRECSYWKQGKCKKGDYCDFAHTISQDSKPQVKVQTTVSVCSESTPKIQSTSTIPPVRVQTRIAIKSIPIMWGSNNQPLIIPTRPMITPLPPRIDPLLSPRTPSSLSPHTAPFVPFHTSSPSPSPQHSPISVQPPIINDVGAILSPKGPIVRCHDDSLFTSKYRCNKCEDGQNIENCVIPKCDTCPNNTQCSCYIRTNSCYCSDCNQLYKVPTCKSCEVHPVVVSTGWKFCPRCMFEKRKTDFIMTNTPHTLRDQSMLNSTNVAAVSAHCFLCMDGKDLKACVTPLFCIDTTQGSDQFGLTPSKSYSSKVQCRRCLVVYNRPLCAVCSRLGERYSAYKFCNECSFFNHSRKLSRQIDPQEAPMKYKRLMIALNGPMFKAGFTYSGMYATKTCGICFDGKYKPAFAINTHSGDKHMCVFCYLIIKL
jgi:hypothetical protein